MSGEQAARGTVLIVDDSPENLRVLVGFLRESGFELAVARSGEEALQRFEAVRPDIVLLDVLMPGLDGFETCRRLRAAGPAGAVPIIFMTALSDVHSKVKGFAAGGVDFIAKPFEFPEVMARVRTHLALRHLQAALEQKAALLEARNAELERKNEELRAALENVRTLRGLLPICTSCKQIRNDQGFWQRVEVYLQEHSEAEFSHSLCPACLDRLYPAR
jgi:DNA-binding response OmpR family regulator